jgi:hypothetical protein
VRLKVLASVPGAHAEADHALGDRINLYATLALFERLAQQDYAPDEAIERLVGRQPPLIDHRAVEAGFGATARSIR